MARLPRFVPTPTLVCDYQGLYPNRNLFYLEKLKLTFGKHGSSSRTYVLMTKHIHRIITPLGEQNLAKALQMLGGAGRQSVCFNNSRTVTVTEIAEVSSVRSKEDS